MHRKSSTIGLHFLFYKWRLHSRCRRWSSVGGWCRWIDRGHKDRVTLCQGCHVMKINLLSSLFLIRSISTQLCRSVVWTHSIADSTYSFYYSATFGKRLENESVFISNSVGFSQWSLNNKGAGTWSTFDRTIYCWYNTLPLIGLWWTCLYKSTD